MRENILETAALSKKFGDNYAVDHVNMTVQKGDIYGFIGKNGAGKTTFIRLITELMYKNGGDVSLFGSTHPKDIHQARKRIGAVIEGPSLYPNMTAHQNLNYYLLQKGIPDKNRINEVLEFVGLKNTGRKKYRNFSMGMKQRLGIGLAILHHPDFLILDEPINGLDPMGIIEIRNIILKLNKTYGTTVFISSHILTELALIANRYGIINNGRLVKELSKEELESESRRYLVLKTLNKEAAVQHLESFLELYQYEVHSDGSIRIFEYIDEPEKISQVMFDAGIIITELKVVEANLEEYFIDLIGGEQK
ncbi:ATP-binding cassette domain-containing protein [Listeria booriae]|uniref:ATP-binding cassette domain-containing protein n=1 Tax=Listeria booriae TaxID=1552123 RepID=A0A7X0XEY5_9LIST|nr:ATP-binding cassette domain-containing protein [Listeria booriae]MBC1492807.1 ATP-binding cassette domain-containing protein [Listeria booriae]MBC1504114.1 ATP-binding cassette domain-containing protein [Listeria booriae]MBC1512616.1 ATP-binding cassette domain-containing protein [Listeria booriae]MBC1524329.1 ATP-binding cassette domain-containing protein [Listeria booriae]MBC1530911.1 ATP-binding cassette domain-containing protein [Listeria booriae]